ncbi:copper amine oxidase [Streptomyces sp. NPDC007808]|uniref:copper amine oxidase n=1 Tax=Streptomyces sp. NPDC007808 TaxID=3364779 RepID=UPI00367628AB
MRVSLRRLALTGASALLTLPAGLSGSAAAAPDAAPRAACSAAATIEKKLPNGTVWRMCWRNDPLAGLVLSDVTYRPKHERAPIRVLAGARLAQINVPYDNGRNEYNDVTQYKFGSLAIPVRQKDCLSGILKSFSVTDPDTGRRHTVKGLCVAVQPRGFAYDGMSGDVGESTDRRDSAQGDDLVLYTVNAVGYYHYITQWNFSDDGTVTAREGATGNLSPSDFDASDSTGRPLGRGSAGKATSHHHNVFWRLDFGPTRATGARVEQYDTHTDGTSAGGYPRVRTTHRTIAKELAGDAANSRWWRIAGTAGKNADGHLRSWEIVQQHTDRYMPHAYTRHDVYFTQNKNCEKYASENEVGGSTSCKSTVDRFVNGERLTHPIVWVNVGFHHVPRDEDQTPMPVHWQGFQIVPRDVTAMSPLTPDRLHDPAHNGDPLD